MMARVEWMTNEWERRFRVFGFSVLRGVFSPSEMAVLAEEADRLLSEDRKGAVFSAMERQQVYGFVEQSSGLRQLLTDDRIYLNIQTLLGEGCVWLGSEGNLYVGDTGWHPDGSDTGYRRIKVIFYLDVLTADAGALRLIPGSHREPFHSMLLPLLGPGRGRVTPFGVRAPKRKQPDETGFGVVPQDVPAVAVTTVPGDVVFIDQNLWHGSFGGGAGKRMFSLSFGERPRTAEHLRLIRAIYEGQLQHVRYRQVSARNKLYSEELLASSDVRLREMLEPQRRLGLE